MVEALLQGITALFNKQELWLISILGYSVLFLYAREFYEDKFGDLDTSDKFFLTIIVGMFGYYITYLAFQGITVLQNMVMKQPFNAKSSVYPAVLFATLSVWLYYFMTRMADRKMQEDRFLEVLFAAPTILILWNAVPLLFRATYFPWHYGLGRDALLLLGGVSWIIVTLSFFYAIRYVDAEIFAETLDRFSRHASMLRVPDQRYLYIGVAVLLVVGAGVYLFTRPAAPSTDVEVEGYYVDGGSFDGTKNDFDNAFAKLRQGIDIQRPNPNGWMAVIYPDRFDDNISQHYDNEWSVPDDIHDVKLTGNGTQLQQLGVTNTTHNRSRSVIWIRYNNLNTSRNPDMFLEGYQAVNDSTVPFTVYPNISVQQEGGRCTASVWMSKDGNRKLWVNGDYEIELPWSTDGFNITTINVSMTYADGQVSYPNNCMDGNMDNEHFCGVPFRRGDASMWVAKHTDGNVLVSDAKLHLPNMSMHLDIGGTCLE